MSTPAHLRLTVQSVEELAPDIRKLVLIAADGQALPEFAAGAHLRFQVRLHKGEPDWRQYSLIDFAPSPGPVPIPYTYTIAVRLEHEGRGGSGFMHGLRAGDTVTAEVPHNDFPLGDHDGGTVLVAGGIGVTPLISMATERQRQGRPVRMVYAGRAPDQMAFVPELRALLGDDLALHIDQEAGAPLNASTLVDGCHPADVLYVCGPQPLLDAVLAAAASRGWPPERVRFEIFTAKAPQLGDQAFELVLQRSGQSLRVPADRTILDCLEEHGHDVLSDCRRGECGVCTVDVIEGEPDHRDQVLTGAEKAGGKVIQICVSRVKGQRLVLDL